MKRYTKHGKKKYSKQRYSKKNYRKKNYRKKSYRRKTSKKKYSKRMRGGTEGIEPASEPATEPAPEPATEPTPEPATEPLLVIQFCHLPKHCSDQTCLDYVDLSTGGYMVDDEGNRLAGKAGQLPAGSAAIATSKWEPFKSVEGTKQLLKMCYPTETEGKEINVVQVDEKEQAAYFGTADFIFFIYCELNLVNIKNTVAIIDHAKKYKKLDVTPCVSTYTDVTKNALRILHLRKDIQLIPDKAIVQTTVIDLDEFVKFTI